MTYDAICAVAMTYVEYVKGIIPHLIDPRITENESDLRAGMFLYLEFEANPHFRVDGVEGDYLTQLHYLSDFPFIKRRLKRVANDERTQFEAKRRAIGGKTGQNYCSDNTLQFIHRGDEKNAQFLRTRYLQILESGDLISMYEVAQHASANRYNETYFLIKNLESIASARKMDAYMLTLTAPSEYHPNPLVGQNTYSADSPADSQEFLTSRWAQFRAKLAKSGLNMSVNTCFGMRTAELHKDACVHWHLLIFIKPSYFSKLEDSLQEYFPDRQSELTYIDPNGSAAATYVQKYLLKIVNDRSEINDDSNPALDVVRADLDLSTVSEADRVRAGIRTMGVRQVSYFGVDSSLTLFRLLNKITEPLTSFSPKVARIIRECRINDRENNTKNRDAYKNFLLRHKKSVKLIHEKCTGKYGRETKKYVGVRFIKLNQDCYVNDKYRVVTGKQLELALNPEPAANEEGPTSIELNQDWHANDKYSVVAGKQLELALDPKRAVYEEGQD
jgi:hypothetical protein